MAYNFQKKKAPPKKATSDTMDANPPDPCTTRCLKSGKTKKQCIKQC